MRPPLWLIIPGLLFLRCLPAGAQMPFVTTFTGTGQPGLINGAADTARFNHPFGLCLGQVYELFIADADNHCIRIIDNNFMASTFAGTGVAGFLDGPAGQAMFNSPAGICYGLDSSILYVCDFQNHRIRKIKDGMVSTLAGTGTAGYQDGPGNQAKFNFPRGICRDNQGTLYVGDSWNHRIRKIAPDGTVSTWAGGGTAFGVGSAGAYLDGPDTAARFYTPSGLGIDPWDRVYVADAYNHRIRMIDPQQQVSTIAGGGPSGPGQGAYVNGPAATARFHTPTEVLYAPYFCPAGQDVVLVSDTYNNRLRIIHSPGQNATVGLYAGDGQAGMVNGPADSARFDFPRAITGFPGDASCWVFVCDYNNNMIREIHDYFSGTGLAPAVVPAFRLNPNPASDAVLITGGLPGIPTSLSITDLTGRSCLPQTTENVLPATIDLQSLEPGIYLLSLKQPPGRCITQKLMVFR